LGIALKTLLIDVETYSSVDLKKSGVYRYTEAPDFHILLFGYSIDRFPGKVVDMKHGAALPENVFMALIDPLVIKIAHNAEFERACLNAHFRRSMPPEQWRCTAAWARSLSLPGDLATLSNVLELNGKGKMTAEGKRLINKFCVPQTGQTNKHLFDDGDWKLFIEYCRRDVEAEMEVADRLSKYPMLEFEQKVWEADQRINGKGLPVDVRLAENIRVLANANREKIEALMVKLIGIRNPNSRNQILEYLNLSDNAPADLRAATVKKLLKTDIPKEIETVLQYRQQLSKSSLSKFDSLIDTACKDGRMRGAFLFAGGGRTNRWAGRGFQPQNLPRSSLSDEGVSVARNLVSRVNIDLMTCLYDNVNDTLSSLIRSCIVAPEGRKLVVADYSSIESVVGAWLSGCGVLLDDFRKGLDAYKSFAVKLYNIPYETVSKAQRNLCKPAVLGAAYGLGAKGLMKYADGFGVKMDQKSAQNQIRTFREAYKEIPEMWDKLMTACCEAIRQKGEVTLAGKIEASFDGLFLKLLLPSRRIMYYYQPKIEEGRYGLEITFLGRDGKTRVNIYGSKIYENVVQAISRDLLANGLLRVEHTGLEIVGHVHDEIICLAEANDSTALNRLIEAMTANPVWCKDAPIKADGFISDYYKKA